MRLSRRGFIAAALAGLASYLGTGTLASGGLELAKPGIGPRGAVFLSDLHLHSRPARDLVDVLRRLRPRLLLLGGDLVDELTPFSIAGELLSGVAGMAGEAIAVLGNHEHVVAARVGFEGIREMYESAGIMLLVDEDIESGGLRIAGLDWRPNPQRYYEALRRLPRAEIVLVHSPDAFVYAERGVWLAGHTHGGQVCLPGARPLATNSLYGYTWGLYRRRGAVMYVTRGAGEMLPPRLFCPREVVVLGDEL